MNQYIFETQDEKLYQQALETHACRVNHHTKVNQRIPVCQCRQETQIITACHPQNVTQGQLTYQKILVTQILEVHQAGQVNH